MNPESLIVADRGRNSELVEELILKLPEGFLPELASQVYSADYVEKQKLVRIACLQRFNPELPRGAAWKNEKSHIFSYKGMNYQLLFWEK